MARPSTPLLSRDRIRDAALALIDSNGLESFSMRRLAGSLGVSAPSLYSHYATREQVLDAVVDLIITDVDTSGFDEGWEEGLLRWARSYRAAIAAHPAVAPLVASGTQHREQFLTMANSVHAGLIRTGWRPRRATEISGAVKFLVIGAACTPFAAGFSDDPDVYEGRFPNLNQAHRLHAEADRIDHDAFELGITSLIRGLHPGPTHTSAKS
ncbi:TetR/AcrR family transcriptional regulator [Ornithinimicrobium faecis]|uniref:TetR/AcrR family transcriptional regulator n=1 Tax=Ornithinimicrobium faecis TaxID=2934158 RepID=UPI0021189594|nr:TetR family transcriptional regulator [Ornithinimicrobium sp. HY1745]